MNVLVVVFAVVVALKAGTQCPAKTDHEDIREEIRLLEQMGDPPPRRYRIKDIKEKKGYGNIIDFD